MISCLAISTANAQTIINTFKVIEKESGLPIPYTSVSMLKAKVAITTEQDGILTIPGNLQSSSDTLVFGSQNYQEYKIAVNKLSGISRISLSPITFQPVIDTRKYKNSAIINNYDDKSVGHYAGVSTETSHFNYLQIAQKFNLPSVPARLERITLSKLKGITPTKFRLRVYDVNASTGGPGNDLCGQIIDVDNQEQLPDERKNAAIMIKESATFTIDLKKYNITLTGKGFFVAVEWLRSQSNKAKTVIYDRETDKQRATTVYRPFIGISPNTGSDLNIWIMGFDRHWEKYMYFAPFGTDLALKAHVLY